MCMSDSEIKRLNPRLEMGWGEAENQWVRYPDVEIRLSYVFFRSKCWHVQDAVLHVAIVDNLH